MKNVLIVGAHSYIGDSFKAYLDEYPEQYKTGILATRDLKPEHEMFQGIDAVFCVAGIAHIKETDKNRHLYFDVNRDLVVEIAKAAKWGGYGSLYFYPQCPFMALRLVTLPRTPKRIL